MTTTVKARVRELLANYDREGMLALLREDRRVVPALNRLLFDDDRLIGWRAATGLGWVAGEDPYVLDKVIGRLIYTMNDDSGSIGWMAPQALGEIGRNDPDLVEDFFRIVISSIDLPVFRSGVLWAIARMAEVRPDIVEDAGPTVSECLSDPSPEIRGLACLALSRLGHRFALKEIERLKDDSASFDYYEDGYFKRSTIGESAVQAIGALS